MKRAFSLCFLLISVLAVQANSLLSSPVSGALGHSRIAAIAIASNSSDAVLLLADKTSVYAIDIADNDPKELAANAITSIPDFVTTKLKPVAGGATLSVLDIEVNPISRAVYVLAEAAGVSYVFKVRNNGATVTLLNLSSVLHSTISWGATFEVNDMTWGNNMLYASSGTFSLDGSVATLAAPFAHGAIVSQRMTSMFKSNWGGSYVTKAPLETMTYGLVKSKHRLMGVTTCAPGFSLDVASLVGSGALLVTEDFNVEYGVSKKVVFQHHDAKDWLFDLHDDNLYRIGSSLLDGSPVTTTKYNNKAVVLRSGVNEAPGIVADVFKHWTGTYTMISYWDDYRLLVLEQTGTLKMMQTASTAPGLSVSQVKLLANVMVYPNPAQHILNVSLQGLSATSLDIYAMDGTLIQHKLVAAGTIATIDVSAFPAGQYLLKANDAATSIAQETFVVQ